VEKDPRFLSDVRRWQRERGSSAESGNRQGHDDIESYAYHGEEHAKTVSMVDVESRGSNHVRRACRVDNACVLGITCAAM
jgi:hypothetical protein